MTYVLGKLKIDDIILFTMKKEVLWNDRKFIRS